MVHSYASSNGLNLNVEKCEILAASINASSLNEFRMGANKIPIKGAIKVLGTWLTRDMISDVVVDENKAKNAFFALESTGLFQGSLNPLTSRDLGESVCSLYSYTAARTGFLTTS